MAKISIIEARDFLRFMDDGDSVPEEVVDCAVRVLDDVARGNFEGYGGVLKDDAVAVAVGNAFDGVSLYGPFATHEDALPFAENQEADWHICKLLSEEE